MSAAKTYEKRAVITELHRFRPSLTRFAQATKKDFVSLYGRLLKSDKPRKLYDKIRANGKPGKCPYCCSGEIGTLDHYLPKAHYALFAITPVNLVPCCERCNVKKREAVITEPSKLFGHPYFDDFNDGQWLSARLNVGAQCSASFFSDPPAEWSEIRKSRITAHFQDLDLGTVYETNAADELCGICHLLDNSSEDGGEEEVRKELLRSAKSRAFAGRNSWQAVLYQTCADSSWYCRGGFRSWKP